MPNYDMQVILHRDTGLPADDTVNVLHFATGGALGDDLGDVLDGIHAAYNDRLLGFLAASINGMTIKAYAEGRNPGGPDQSKDYAFQPTTAGSGPAEVAVCLSYSTTDDPEASQPRGRGRIYIGPLSESVCAHDRPIATVRQGILDFGAQLATVGTGADTTWMMYSQRDSAYRKIEGLWVDDAFDVQRRRGLNPTLRDKRDVQ